MNGVFNILRVGNVRPHYSFRQIFHVIDPQKWSVTHRRLSKFYRNNRRYRLSSAIFGMIFNRRKRNCCE